MVDGRRVAGLLAGTCLLALTAGNAEAEVRALNLINTHTQERANVVFKRDGVYDQNGLQELNRLLRDWRRNEVTRMDPALFDLIWEVYRDAGARDPINIVCGYRSPATNNMLRERSRGVAKFSQHMLGKAMDFYMPDVPLSTVREIGMRKQVGGVGFYPSSGSPFVHMDTGSVRAWPRMSREQLVRLFPDGKTAHLPSDGKPLAGYEEALARAEARKSHGAEPETSSSGGGLLAALFGGSSSKSNSAVVAGEDEEEAAVPVSRRGRDLKQGPLPAPAVAAAPAAPSRVASATPTPPPAPVYQPLPGAAPVPRPVQMAALAPSPAPVPTAVARGSVVPMPVQAPLQAAGGRSLAPLPAPAQTASAPSRYAPQGDELPPGWVRGPTGRPIGEAQPTVAPAPAPAVTLARIDAPLPTPKPGTERAVLAAVQGLKPIDVALPQPRPVPGRRVADAGPIQTPAQNPVRIDPTQAFALLTGEKPAEEVALGYAPASEATGTTTPPPARVLLPDLKAGAIGTPIERRDLASLPPSALPAVVAPAAAAPAAPAAAAAIPSRYVAKTDRTLPPAPKPASKADRGESRLLATATADGGDFALLRHPDQASIDGLMNVPKEALAGGFVTASLGVRPLTGFTGPAVVALPIVRIE
jgi:uncharacterized protein YcbK (DUF882 family)